MGMDNAEAIRRIEDHMRVHGVGEYPHIKIAEALNMAISALANGNNVGHKVEVVRCKDCKYKDEKIHTCTNVKYRGERIHIWVEPDDFCSYGERRTDA